MTLNETEIKRLIEDNITLVYGVVSKEYPTFIHDEDIIGSGTLGLCKAANTWNPEKANFSTYAWRCIRNEINQEFIRRKPYSKVVSMDTTVGEDLTLEDVLMGDDDVPYIDEESFYRTLTPDERTALSLNSEGYDTKEIADTLGCSTQKVCKMLRVVRAKWNKYVNP